MRIPLAVTVVGSTATWFGLLPAYMAWRAADYAAWWASEQVADVAGEVGQWLDEFLWSIGAYDTEEVRGDSARLGLVHAELAA